MIYFIIILHDAAMIFTLLYKRLVGQISAVVFNIVFLKVDKKENQNPRMNPRKTERWEGR